jgi:WD40 repeat protein/tRNA A-37 threonylcarbamoyl transferase component Bud32
VTQNVSVNAKADGANAHERIKMTNPAPDHSRSDITPTEATADGKPPYPDAAVAPTVGLPGGTPLLVDETMDYVPPSAGGPILGADETLMGDYELLGKIARGGIGVVYKARHRKLNRVVALKVHRAGHLASADEAQRFQVEAEAAAKLDHPHIVPIYEVSQIGGLPCISMALVDGPSLATRVAEQPLAPREAAAIMRQVAEAVAYAHSQGVIHRDLKPSNILVDAAGQPRVTDFGLAKRADADSSLTQAGQVMGTPSYMPPEQAEGKNDQVGPLSDVYSLGATLYCLVTGRPPFQSASVVETLKQVVEQEPVAPRFLNPAVDRDLDTICLKCLQKRPEKRYASATALAEDLQRYLDKRPIHARPVGHVEKLVRWGGRNPYITVLLAGIVGVFVLAFVLVSWSYFHAEKARKVAEQREKDERWERYRANMIAVGSAMQLHNVSAAQAALAAAPDEHRNWEWHYFIHQLDTAQHVIHLGDDIHLVSISEDGAMAAAQARSGPVQLWNLRKRQEIGVIGNREPAMYFWFSPDNQMVAFDAGDGAIVICSTVGTRERLILTPRGGGYSNLQFNPNGARLMASLDDHLVHVWDTVTGKKLLVVKGHEGAPSFVLFSPNGRRIATLRDTEGTLRIWDAESGQLLKTLEPHDGAAGLALFNRQGDRILLFEKYPSSAMRLWNAETGNLVAVMRGHTNAAERGAFSPDGTRFASGGLDRTIRVWDGRTGQPLWSREGHRDRISSVDFSPDSKFVISSSYDQTARLWDAATGAPLGVLHGHTAAISLAAARYTADGDTIVTGSAADGTIRLWDAHAAERNGSLRGHENFVYSVAFHPDGERVASAAWDGTIRIWDATTGRQLAVMDHPSPGPGKAIVSSVAFHPGGNLVASFARDGAVRVWDLTTKEVFSFQLPADSNFDYLTDSRLAFSSRGNLLAIAGGHDNSVHVWDVEHRAEVAVLKGHDLFIKESCFSPDDSWLATCGGDRTVRIWDVAKQQQSHVLEGHTNQIEAVAVSRDGKWLASGSSDGTVRLWDAHAWKEAAVLNHGTTVYGVAFSPDGSRLASACANNMIRFWDVATHQLVAELDGHSAYVHQVAFSPDGTRLVSGSGDFTVRIWDTLSVKERAERMGEGRGH